MPALLVGLVGMHLAIFRWNGPAGPPIDEAPKLKPGRFWPDQMFMDTVLSFAMFVIILALAFVLAGTARRQGRPEQRRSSSRIRPGISSRSTRCSTSSATCPRRSCRSRRSSRRSSGPTLLIVLLLVLPFIDRNPSRRLSRRPWVLGITALVMLGAIGLSAIGQRNVVENQLAHNIIGPNAPVATAVSSGSTATSTGPLGTASTTSSSASSGGTTPATAGAGATVYASNCAGCHGATGTGVPETFPPLAGNPFVTGDKNAVIGVVLNGLSGNVTVKGDTYNGQMPAWKGNLTNKQIADVITYIRNAWGNKASPVTEADVAGYKK